MVKDALIDGAISGVTAGVAKGSQKIITKGAESAANKLVFNEKATNELRTLGESCEIGSDVWAKETMNAINRKKMIVVATQKLANFGLTTFSDIVQDQTGPGVFGPKEEKDSKVFQP